jgi:hypothetical protein
MALDASTGFYFELIIISVGAVWDVLTLLKYLQKRNPMTLLLFLLFVNWTVGIVFSWLSKYFEAFVYGIQQPIPLADPNYWIVTRIRGFRISFIFVTIALYISYYLRVKLFGKEMNKISNAVHIIFGVTTCAASLFLYNVISPDDSIDNIIVFGLVLAYMSIVYLPFMSKSISIGKTQKGTAFKGAFFSLALMSAFFICVFIFFLIDQLYGMITGIGYTIYYFLAWISAIAGFISAYFGYIRPPRK